MLFTCELDSSYILYLHKLGKFETSVLNLIVSYLLVGDLEEHCQASLFSFLFLIGNKKYIAKKREILQKIPIHCQASLIKLFY
jgi:hypothetical protein